MFPTVHGLENRIGWSELLLFTKYLLKFPEEGFVILIRPASMVEEYRDRDVVPRDTHAWPAVRMYQLGAPEKQCPAVSRARVAPRVTANAIVHVPTNLLLSHV